MNRNPAKGAVATGHAATAEAAAFALREGGNAFDAAIAAHWTACVAEPVLTSLGGGGFLLAQQDNGQACVYDFFAQTPVHKRPGTEIDFHPIHADFGTTLQEFHIGYGAVATPGTVRGLFAIHEDLGSLPMPVLMEPAVELARKGLRVNRLQAYIMDIVRPVYLATPQAAQRFTSPSKQGSLVGEGETLYLPELADTLLALGHEGERLFYEGDIAMEIDSACRSAGGHLRREDLARYRVIKRDPLRIKYRGSEFLTNPPPSSGGLLIGFALKLLEKLVAEGILIDSTEGVSRLAEVMHATNEARLDSIGNDSLNEQLLDPELLRRYQDQVRDRTRAFRGTTHISVIDRNDMAVAVTLSNGEGCGVIIPGCGFMLNNMLGEEDINPGGLGRWQENRRMASMMAPSILEQADGGLTALGSGGSNRIRTAMTQVINRLNRPGSTLEDSIAAPRSHVEGETFFFEDPDGQDVDRANVSARSDVIDFKPFRAPSMFFGGVHAVRRLPDGSIEAAGDPRRAGCAHVVDA